MKRHLLTAKGERCKEGGNNKYSSGGCEGGAIPNIDLAAEGNLRILLDVDDVGEWNEVADSPHVIGHHGKGRSGSLDSSFQYPSLTCDQLQEFRNCISHSSLPQ